MFKLLVFLLQQLNILNHLLVLSYVMRPKGEHIHHGCLMAHERFCFEWEALVFYEVLCYKWLCYQVNHDILLHELQESVPGHHVFSELGLFDVFARHFEEGIQGSELFGQRFPVLFDVWHHVVVYYCYYFLGNTSELPKSFSHIGSSRFD